MYMYVSRCGSTFHTCTILSCQPNTGFAVTFTIHLLSQASNNFLFGSRLLSSANPERMQHLYSRFVAWLLDTTHTSYQTIPSHTATFSFRW